MVAGRKVGAVRPLPTAGRRHLGYERGGVTVWVPPYRKQFLVVSFTGKAARRCWCNIAITLIDRRRAARDKCKRSRNGLLGSYGRDVGNPENLIGNIAGKLKTVGDFVAGKASKNHRAQQLSTNSLQQVQCQSLKNNKFQ